MPAFKKVYSYAVIICLAAFQILLLITCIRFFKEPPLSTTLRFNLPSLDPQSNYSERALRKKMQHKIITQVNLTGNLAYDDTLLSYVQISTRLQQQNNDTMQVIKVHFSPSCTYGQFIRLVNMMILEQQCCYALVEDNFYIFQISKTQ